MDPMTTNLSVENDPRWSAVLRRDPAFGDAFVYAVKSTGIYCRPTCAARRAKPEHVVFHATWKEAERAGFRPCRRCRPNEAASDAPLARLIAAACRRIADSDAPPSLETLAAAAKMSPSHFHRLFKSATGLTPRAYGAAHRAQRLRQGLADNERSVTDAIYAAGFNSSSRFYAASDAILGMTPGAFRKGGAGAAVAFATAECSLGKVLVARSDRGVCAILLGDDAKALAGELRQCFPQADLATGDAGFDALVAQVVAFVDAPRRGLDLPLDIRGTVFQQRVWQALRAIPAGETASYAEIARRIGAPRAARAVARACADNKIAVAVPCHRVTRGDGTLSGYRWGMARKRALLAKERED